MMRRMGFKGRSRWLFRLLRRYGEDISDALRYQQQVKHYTVQDRTFCLWAGERYSRRWCFRTFKDVYEPGGTAVISSWLDDSPLFVDVGANIGWFSALAAARGVDVVAFEMQARFLTALRKNLTLNSTGQELTVEHAAVGDRVGEVRASRFGSDRSSIFEGSGALVRMTSLDKYFNGKLPPGTTIKVDVEGAESLVCEGMLTILRSCSIRALFEVHPGRVDPVVFRRRLEGFGLVEALWPRGGCPAVNRNHALMLRTGQ